MTRSQVQFLLGTPMVADSFHRDRWDYAYYFRQGRSRDVDRRWLVVHFDSDRVARIERDLELQPASLTRRAGESRAGAVDFLRALDEGRHLRRRELLEDFREHDTERRHRHLEIQAPTRCRAPPATPCESPLAAESPKRPRHELDPDALGPLQRVARPEL